MISGALYLNETSFSALPLSFIAAAVRFIFPLTIIYVSLLAHKYDLSIEVSNLLLTEIVHLINQLHRPIFLLNHSMILLLICLIFFFFFMVK